MFDNKQSPNPAAGALTGVCHGQSAGLPDCVNGMNV